MRLIRKANCTFSLLTCRLRNWKEVGGKGNPCKITTNVWLERYAICCSIRNCRK